MKYPVKEQTTQPTYIVQIDLGNLARTSYQGLF